MSFERGPHLRARGTPLSAALAVLAAAVLLPACASSPPKPAAAGASSMGYTQRGIASWYGPGFHGKTTANGERYNMHTFTAAHRTLPMGSLVEVRSLTNDTRVKVRINDRGPFVRGRIIDLSYKAAKALGMAVTGTDEVEIRVIGHRESPSRGGILSVQVGSFEEEANALALKTRLQRSHSHVRVTPVELFTGRRYRVLVGQFVSEGQAEAMAGRLAAELATDTLVVRVDR